MKIAFTTKGEDWDSAIDPRFGRAEYISLFDEEKNEFSCVDNSEIAQQDHGAGPITAKKLFDLEADVLITGNGPGQNAAKVLESAQIKIFVGAGSMTTKQAFEAYKNQKLEELTSIN